MCVNTWYNFSFINNIDKIYVYTLEIQINMFGNTYMHVSIWYEYSFGLIYVCVCISVTSNF